jgi:hypothetical protein
MLTDPKNVYKGFKAKVFSIHKDDGKVLSNRI